MKQKHVLNCQLPSWYHLFKNVTFRSKIIPLQQQFIDYLNEDGIVLPSGNDSQNECEVDSDDWSEIEEDSAGIATAPVFEELTKKIKEAIDSLGGAAFPKLNWSAPRDSAWINYNGTLQCTTPSDVYLLLKSSDRVSHDINHPFRKCEDGEDNEMSENSRFVLVLRKWHEIPSSTEFRCFVRKGHVAGISQRDTASHYPYIAEFYSDIHAQIKEFFHKKIANKFPDSDYVFDVFLQSKTVVKLVDFNPFGEVTDPLLFTWDELSNVQPDDQDDTMFRFVTSDAGVQPSPFLSSGLPRESLDLARSEDINKMVDFLKTNEVIDTSQNNDP